MHPTPSKTRSKKKVQYRASRTGITDLEVTGPYLHLIYYIPPLDSLRG